MLSLLLRKYWYFLVILEQIQGGIWAFVWGIGIKQYFYYIYDTILPQKIFSRCCILFESMVI